MCRHFRWEPLAKSEKHESGYFSQHAMQLKKKNPGFFGIIIVKKNEVGGQPSGIAGILRLIRLEIILFK